MRPLEILLVVGLLVAILVSYLLPTIHRARKLSRTISIWPSVALLVALIQLLLEGYRWQLIPAYLLAVLLFVVTRRSTPPASAGWLGVFRLLAPLLMWLVAALLPYLLPIPRLLTPSGPFPIGTTVVHLVDASRPDPYSSPPGQPRELVMQVWYPASGEPTGPPAPYMSRLDIAAPVLAAQIGFPSFSLNHLQLVKTHAYPDMPLAIAAEPYPVLIFSHGLTGFRSQNSYQTENLASHGYVVAAVDHTYAAAMTVLPPDRVRVYNPDVIDNSTSASAYKTRNRLIRQWAADISLMLDQLQQWQEGDSLLSGQLDLDRVAIFGHSTGAGAAVQFCGQDPRCQAALLLDGWFEPVSDDIIDAPFAVPVMFIQQVGGLGSDNNKQRMNQLFSGTTAGAYRLEIAGAQHYDFADIPLLSPITPWLGLTGDIGAKRILPIINDYTLAFFGNQMRGENNALLDGPDERYPELSFQSR